MQSYFDGYLNFEDDEDIDDVLANLTYEETVKVISTILNALALKGAFQVTENHIIHKCLKKLEKEKNEK